MVALSCVSSSDSPWAIVQPRRSAVGLAASETMLRRTPIHCSSANTPISFRTWAESSFQTYRSVSALQHGMSARAVAAGA